MIPDPPFPNGLSGAIHFAHEVGLGDAVGVGRVRQLAGQARGLVCRQWSRNGVEKVAV